MAKILLVEDDADIQFTVSTVLTKDMHTVESVGDGIEASDRLLACTYDLIILDLDLPRRNGLQVCREFREQGGKTPILMLTAKSTIEEKAGGLDCGADDYLTKPFDTRELQARLRALLRRPSDILQNTVLRYGPLELNTSTRRLSRDGEDVYLVPRDFELLEFFMRHPGQVFSTEALLERVWHTDKDVSPDALRSSLKRVRQKIGDTNCSIIENLPKVGYRFQV
jgi:DNA-binding response OmpR family regulator